MKEVNISCPGQGPTGAPRGCLDPPARSCRGASLRSWRMARPAQPSWPRDRPRWLRGLSSRQHSSPVDRARTCGVSRRRGRGAARVQIEHLPVLLSRYPLLEYERRIRRDTGMLLIATPLSQCALRKVNRKGRRELQAIQSCLIDDELGPAIRQ